MQQIDIQTFADRTQRNFDDAARLIGQIAGGMALICRALRDMDPEAANRLSVILEAMPDDVPYREMRQALRASSDPPAQ